MNYTYLLRAPASDRWQKIGISRRAGIVVPLFSLYSKNSIGVGDLGDLKLLVDWSQKTGMTILQLLPLNEFGSDNAPYNAISTFALEPIYINLYGLKGVDLNFFTDDLAKLKKRFPQRKLLVNYAIKKAKLELLWKMFSGADMLSPGFTAYCTTNSYWLEDYAVFKVISELLEEPIWENWGDEYKNKSLVIEKIKAENALRIEFFKWVQWQLFEQMHEVKEYANEKGVFLMGDLPFLVSRDSADVWAHQNYFNLELSAGAPPDMYFALGQKWGMPPYNWYEIANDDFCCIREKLKYSENFYDMYRIDHFVGLFRIWTIPLNFPPEEAAFRGKYDPEDERLWEEHGKAILNAMLESSSMLPCGEDLGTVPSCSYKTLYEYGIPGIEFQRYLKEPARNFEFKSPYDYRINSCCVISTHDSSFFFNWWKHEAGTVDERMFEMLCTKQGLNLEQVRDIKKTLFNKRLSGHGRLFWNDEINSRELLLSIVKPPPETENNLGYTYLNSYGEKGKFLEYNDYTPGYPELGAQELIYRSLDKINQSASIFSIQLIQEYLALDEELFRKMNRWGYRINTPASVSAANWSILLPCSLEELLELNINNTVKEIVTKSGRI